MLQGFCRSEYGHLYYSATNILMSAQRASGAKVKTLDRYQRNDHSKTVLGGRMFLLFGVR